jgi:hypothetical protein
VPSSADTPIDRVARIAEQTPDLRLLLLFGSRARNDSHARSDWAATLLVPTWMRRRCVRG